METWLWCQKEQKIIRGEMIAKSEVSNTSAMLVAFTMQPSWWQTASCQSWDKWVCVCTHMCVCVCTLVCTCLYMCTGMCTHNCVCMWGVHFCVHVCAYTNACRYISFSTLGFSFLCFFKKPPHPNPWDWRETQQLRVRPRSSRGTKFKSQYPYWSAHNCLYF